MHSVVEQIAQEYRLKLQELYGHEFDRLIVFGSYARNDYHNESDLDFAIVIKREQVSSREIYKTADISAALGLKYGVMLSNLPVSERELQSSMQPIFQNIRQEGVTV